MILNGELGVGQRVPEMELAERFGVSRSPIREAVRALDAVGLVEVVPNRGAYIRRIELAEAIEVYEVRAALFGQAGRLMAQRGSEGNTGGCASFMMRWPLRRRRIASRITRRSISPSTSDRRRHRQSDTGCAISHAGQAAAAVRAAI